MTSKVLHISTIDQYSTLIRNHQAVVVDCSAKWCGPCKQIAPKYDEMSNEFQSVVFTKMDVDEAEDLSQYLHIESMPTFIFIKNGIIVDQFSGADIKHVRRSVELIQ